MSNPEDDIDEARESLQNALGDKFTEYMLHLKKWFSGKTTKQEFDNEARSIVTDNYIHLHNEFILRIITKCNNFTSMVTDAANKPLSNKQTLNQDLLNKKTIQKAKKKLKTSNQTTQGSKSTLFRFVPVDSIKHAPSIGTHSLETAALSTKDFSLEFCARERSLPYFKMIHNRLLLGAIDFNLQNIDIKTVFLLAEATIWLLKNIISMLASRSEFKKNIRCESAYENYKQMCHLNDVNLFAKKKQSFKSNLTEFAICPNVFKKKSNQQQQTKECSNANQSIDMEEERETLDRLSNNLDNPAIVPNKKLPTTLFDLKNLLQCHRHLMPSHSIYTINMEKLICNLYHDDDEEQVDSNEKDLMS